MGLSATLTRETARLSAMPGKEREMRDLLRTLELLYWAIAVVIGILVIALSPYIAHHWIKPGNLSPSTVQRTLLVMGFAIALQWPASLYSGGLMGLQRQVLLTGVNIATSTLRSVGAVLVLWLVSPTIEAFLLWQAVTSAVTTLILALALWRMMPGDPARAAFRKQLLIGIWRFAAGMSAMSILAVILTQVDKIVLSRLLPLEQFGYYVLAGTVAMSLTRLFTPVFYSIYPRFTQLASRDNQRELIELYHKSCQFMSVLVLPAAVVLALFSYDALLLWTHDPVVAGRTDLLVSILVFGTALNGLMNPPHALQLAYGWTRLNVVSNAVAVVVLVPAIIFAAMRFGAVGAAYAWLALNLGYVLLMTPIMHRRLLRTEMWIWYRQDVAIPLLACVVTAGTARLILPEPASPGLMLLRLFVVSMATLAAGLFATPRMREMVLHWFTAPAQIGGQQA
jgi:O-antigen/teichoic acid export membrane protein